MLHAYLHKKLGRLFMPGVGEESGHDALAEKLRGSEDPLTAMVFGRLRYLPAGIIWRLLFDRANLVRGNKPPPDVTAFAQIFWPGLEPALQQERQRVEPDLIWQVPGEGIPPDIVVLFEMKWYGMQSIQQLEAQWAAARHRWPVPVQLYLVAVGGLDGDEWRRGAKLCQADHLLALRWRDIQDAMRSLIEGKELRPHEKYVVEDILAIFGDRGLEPAWFDSLPHMSIDPECLPRVWRPVHEGLRGFDTLPPIAIDPSALSAWRPI